MYIISSGGVELLLVLPCRRSQRKSLRSMQFRSTQLTEHRTPFDASHASCRMQYNLANYACCLFQSVIRVFTRVARYPLATPTATVCRASCVFLSLCRLMTKAKHVCLHCFVCTVQWATNQGTVYLPVQSTISFMRILQPNVQCLFYLHGRKGQIDQLNEHWTCVRSLPHSFAFLCVPHMAKCLCVAPAWNNAHNTLDYRSITAEPESTTTV